MLNKSSLVYRKNLFCTKIKTEDPWYHQGNLLYIYLTAPLADTTAESEDTKAQGRDFVLML